MARTIYFAVGEILFEWDEEKAEGNLKKHHLSFEDGATVFKDYNALLLDDPDQFDDEVRFELLGYSTKRQLLVVVHVDGVRDFAL